MKKPWNSQPMRQTAAGLVVPRKITRRIVVEADDTGVITAEGVEIQPDGTEARMDTRHLVIGLLKVVFDTTAVLFQHMNDKGVSPDGKNGNDNTSV